MTTHTHMLAQVLTSEGKRLLWLGAALALVGCPDPIISNNRVSFDVAPCFTGAADEMAASCDEDLNALLSEAETNACLVLRLRGEGLEGGSGGGAPVALPGQWRDGSLSLLSETSLDFQSGDILDVELYFFKQGAEPPSCDAESFAMKLDCLGENGAWCALRLEEPNTTLSDQLVVDFLDERTQACNSQGAGCSQTTRWCADGIQNGDETGVDCGGSCGVCAIGGGCVVSDDCESGVCAEGVCLDPSCEDQVQNGDELGVDCGGVCGLPPEGGAPGEAKPCPGTADQACRVATDCSTGVCEAERCVPDSDGDGLPDTLDNCPAVANPGQENLSPNALGDACDPDIDGDGFTNEPSVDNCPVVFQVDQLDTDSDGEGDVCDTDDDGDTVLDEVDNCKLVVNSLQEDNDSDGEGDVCDTDDDNDEVLDDEDNCPTDVNPRVALSEGELGEQPNTDGDAQGDACDPDDDNDGFSDDRDNCPTVPNPDQRNSNGTPAGDACENDADGDRIPNDIDNCPTLSNYNIPNRQPFSVFPCETDVDCLSRSNERGRCEDVFPAVSLNGQPVSRVCADRQLDTDIDGTGDACDIDNDNDGVLDFNFSGTALEDNCPFTVNEDQLDSDSDGLGDACDCELGYTGDGVVCDSTAPVAVADVLTVNEDSFASVNVLINDTDNDPNSALSLLGCTQGASGVVTVDVRAGVVTYAPALNYVGSDTFECTIIDVSEQQSTASVSVTVVNVNDAPVAVADALTVAEEAAGVVRVLDNDTDIDVGDSRALVSCTQGARGAVSANTTTGVVTYTPSLNFVGADTFNCTMRDAAGAQSSAAVSVTVTSVNDAPAAVADTLTLPEDTLGVVSVLTNDTDVDLANATPNTDSLSLVSCTQGTRGAVSANTTTGVVTYTPSANFVGADTFNCTIKDSANAQSTAAVSVSVTSVNDAPVAVADTLSVNEETAGTVSVLANDTDVDLANAAPNTDTLTLLSCTPPSNGAHVVNTGTGEVTYTPVANYIGVDVFTCTIRDAANARSTATVSVTVGARNDAPVAVADTLTVAEDASGTVSVLANDTDNDLANPAPNTDSLSLVSCTQGTRGAVSANTTTGVVTYTPSANFVGADTFNCVIKDSADAQSTAAVSVTVTSVNDAPVAVADTLTVAEDASGTVNVLTNDTDVDRANAAPNTDTLTLVSCTSPSNGTRSANTTTGVVTYTPAAHFVGADFFTCTIKDAANVTSTAAVSVTVTSVNDAPVAVADALTVAEDTSGTLSVLANDTDVDLANAAPNTDSLSLVSCTQGARGAVSANTATGVVTYTPSANFVGADTFNCVIKDSADAQSTAAVSVTVTSVNDAPVAVADTLTVAEDASGTVSVLTNDTDVDTGNTPADTLTLVSCTTPSNGTRSANTTTGVVTYTPAANFVGADFFTCTIKDAANVTSTAAVSVTVTSVNDAPVAVADSLTVVEDVAGTVSVLLNDTDVDLANAAPNTDSLSLVSCTSPASGTSAANTTTGVVTYTPNAHFVGADTFNCIIKDSANVQRTAAVSVTVTSVNDAPVAVADSLTVAEDASGTVSVLANDTDVDTGNTPADTLTLVSCTTPSNGTRAANTTTGVVTYTPNAHFVGADFFTCTIKDAANVTSTAAVSVTVTSVNDAPVAVADSLTVVEDVAGAVRVLLNDTDVDLANAAPNTDSLSLVSCTSPASGTSAANTTTGVVTYTPNAHFVGADTFNCIIKDSANVQRTAAVNVTVTSVNDAPVAVADSLTVAEDASGTVSVLTNDTDVDLANAAPNTDTLTLVSCTTPSNGTRAANTTTGVVTYTPAAHFVGADFFTCTIKDAANVTSTAAVSVTVTSVNDAPVAVADSLTVAEDASGTVSVLLNDTDVDLVNAAPNTDAISLVSCTAPTSGTSAANTTTGVVTYTPNANFVGADTFNCVIKDSANVQRTAAVNVTVTSVNDAPVAVADSLTVVEDASGTVNVLTNDTDVDAGDTRALVSCTAPSSGSRTVNTGTGAVTYTPNANFVGSDTFNCTIRDAASATSTAAVTVTVTNVNDNPTAVADSLTVNENSPGVIPVLQNDVDPDLSNPTPDVLSIVSCTAPNQGTRSVNTTLGVVAYAPNRNFNGSDSFSCTIRDVAGGQSTATVSVTVTSVNNAPVAVADTLTVAEDGSGTVNILANDTDEDFGDATPDVLSIQSCTNASNGTRSFVANTGVVTYTPNAHFIGSDTFSCTIKDRSNATSTATVTVTVTSVNDHPVAVADSLTVVEDGSGTVSVLTNDTDVDKNNAAPNTDVLSLVSCTQGAKGSVSANTTTGVVTYTPNANAVGSDTFNCTIRDLANAQSTAAVSVTVTNVNDAPVAVADTLTVVEDGSGTVSVLTNDTDVDTANPTPDVLTLVSCTQGTKGSVNANTTTGVVTYTPNANAVGSDTFNCTIRDAANAQSTAAVSVTVTNVNDAPVAVADTLTVVEDGSGTVSVLTNDTDVDTANPTPDVLTLVSCGDGTSGTTTEDLVTGVVTYTPNGNFVGSDSFNCTISDGTAQSTAAVSVTVTNVNDAPVAVADTLTTSRNTAGTVNVLTNDTDVDTANPTPDVITLVSCTDGSNGVTTEDVTTGVVTYTPNNGYDGSDSFTCTITDGAAQATASVSVTVTP